MYIMKNAEAKVDTGFLPPDITVTLLHSSVVFSYTYKMYFLLK